MISIMIMMVITVMMMIFSPRLIVKVIDTTKSWFGRFRLDHGVNEIANINGPVVQARPVLVLD